MSRVLFGLVVLCLASEFIEYGNDTSDVFEGRGWCLLRLFAVRANVRGKGSRWLIWLIGGCGLHSKGKEIEGVEEGWNLYSVEQEEEAEALGFEPNKV